MPTFLMLLLMFISVLLILVILLQRGRGGGLVGALSGLGGQSAFGTKAGDMFTRITIGMAAVWVLLAGISGQVLRARTDKAKEFEDAFVAPAGSDKKDSSSDATKSSEPFDTQSLFPDDKTNSTTESSKSSPNEGDTKSTPKAEEKPAKKSEDEAEKPKSETKPDGGDQKSSAKSDGAAEKSSDSPTK